MLLSERVFDNGGMADGYLSEETRLWVQAEADKHFGGNFGRAAAAILEAAHARALNPEDRWAELTAQVHARPRK